MNRTLTTLTAIALIVFATFSAFLISGAVETLLPVVGIEVESLWVSMVFGIGLLYGGFIFMWNAVKRFRDQHRSKWFPAIGAAVVFTSEAGTILSHAYEMSGTAGSKFAFIGVGLMIGRALMEVSLADTIEQSEADKTGQIEADKIRKEKMQYRLEALKIKEQYKNRTPDTGPVKADKPTGVKLSGRMKRIAEWNRDKNGITQKELAEELGISTRQIRRDLKVLNGNAV